MHRLAVYGWDEDTPRLLEAFQACAPFALVAVGDRSASALVRARAATGCPCYPHALEMFRNAEYDAALLTTANGGAEAAEAAAEAGAAVLLCGSRADSATLTESAEAALHAHVPFVLVRPRLQQAGIGFLMELAAADNGWRPHFLDLTVTAPEPALELARDAIALANRLMQAAPHSVVASTLGDDNAAEPAVIAAELRYEDGRLVTLRTRTASAGQTLIFADSPLGELELRGGDDSSAVTMSMRDGRSETSHIVAGNILAMEAQRAARAIGGAGDDALLAPRDGGVLLALETSIETGLVTTVEERSSRANLVLVQGRGTRMSRRRGQLHLVGV